MKTILQAGHIITGADIVNAPLPGIGVLAISGTYTGGDIEVVMESGGTVTLPPDIIQALYPRIKAINVTDGTGIYIGFDAEAIMDKK